MKKIISMTSCALLLVVSGCASGNYYNPYQQTPQTVYDSNETQDQEEYSEIVENPFIRVEDMAFSTFGADVDTASYSIIRRKLLDNVMPDSNAVRIEEMLNYFDYDLPVPSADEDIAVHAELGIAPWNDNHLLLMVGLKTPDIVFESSAPNNIVFLMDTSGSMSSADKLPLLKTAIRTLVDELRPMDKLSMVAYAGSAGIVLEGGDVSSKGDILDALDSLEAGGSTAGGAGINLAYQVAERQWITGGNNRVILATDGDFNVGLSSDYELEQLITRKRDSGVFLSVLGFGEGNLKDSKMQILADKGNGIYHYIDSAMEAKKVFVDELGGSLITVAKDVKLQLEFNPYYVKAHRLIGYENRVMQYDEFSDDAIDSGDMGAGHEVIALYEIIPAGSAEVVAPIEFDIAVENKYTGQNHLDEIVDVGIHYKEPDGSVSHLVHHAFAPTMPYPTNSTRFILASTVAEFGLVLRNSDHKGDATYGDVIQRLLPIADDDIYWTELLALVRKANQLAD